MSFFRKYLTGSVVAGVEVHLNGPQTIYRCVILKRSGNKVKTEKVSADFHSLAELSGFCNDNVPVILVITGKGVITRFLPEGPGTEPHQLLRKVLPDISVADFFCSLVPLSDTSTIVSMVRRDAVKEVLDELHQRSSVVQGFAGAGVVHQLPVFHSEQHEIHAGNYLLSSENGILTSVKNSSEIFDEEINIGGENIPARAVLACAAALKGILFRLNEFSGSVAFIPKANEAFYQKQALRFTMKAALAGLLMVLGINYAMFSHYRNELGNLESDVSGYRNAIAELNLKEEEAARKKLFLTETGLYERSSWSWYADRLIHDMPSRIRLDKLELSPVIPLVQEDTVAFDQGVVRMRGFGSENAVVNSWIEKLQHTEWVKQVKLQSYDNTATENSGAFFIELKLK